MSKKEERKMKRKTFDYPSILPRLLAVLLFLVLMTSSMVSGRYARYVTEVSGQDDARVANFRITQDVRHNAQTWSETMMLDLVPGEDVTITFKVVNDSEVAVQNIVTLTNTTGNIPLMFQIGETTKQEGSVSGSDVMEPGASEQTYTATVSMPEGEDALPYIGMVDLITLTLVSEQID